MYQRLLFILLMFAALLPLSAQTGDATADSLYQTAENLYQENRPREAMTLAQTALRKAEKQRNEELQTEIYSLLSAIYQRLGMFEEALNCLQICLDADTKTGDKENISSDLNNMAALFISLKQYDKARQHIDRAIEIEENLQESVPCSPIPSASKARDATLAHPLRHGQRGIYAP